jgi:hypothetical protein
MKSGSKARENRKTAGEATRPGREEGLERGERGEREGGSWREVRQSQQGSAQRWALLYRS